MKKIIVFVLEDQLCSLFFGCCCCSRSIIPFLLDEKSTWESPQPQNFWCFFLSFGAPIYYLYMRKKRCVCGEIVTLNEEDENVNTQAA